MVSLKMWMRKTLLTSITTRMMTHPSTNLRREREDDAEDHHDEGADFSVRQRGARGAVALLATAAAATETAEE